MESSRLRVALDTTYAGINTTGVGIYSRRMVAYMRAEARRGRIALRCYGPACGGDCHSATLYDICREWPSYTHVAMPLKLRSYHPHVVHSTSHIGPLWGTGKHIVTVHDLIFMRYPADYNKGWLAITRAALPSVLRRADAVIADSETTRNDLLKFFPVSGDKVRVIYPGVDTLPPAEDKPEQIAALREELEVGGNRYILCMGPWVRRKNLPVVLEAFARLSRYVSGVDLVVTGTGASGMKGATPQEMVARLPGEVRRRVHLTGFAERERLFSILRQAAVLAYPSRFEGFGLPPLEAMSAGVPVVASETPVVVEVTGGAALIAPVDEVAAWESALASVLSQPDTARRLVKAGLAQSRLFSWERCGAETNALYRELAGC